MVYFIVNAYVNKHEEKTMGFGGTGGGGGSISGASDANISNPATNNMLLYSNVGKWTNTPVVGTAALATGGGQETVVTDTTATGTQPIDLSGGNVFNNILTGNVTYTFTGATSGKACAFSLYQKQDGTGNRTVAWPSSVKWAGGTAPTLSTAANSMDVLVFESLDGGTSWYGSLVGANFS